MLLALATTSFGAAAWAVWSYFLMPGNLTLIQWSPYLNFQNWMWQIAKDPMLVASLYVLIISVFATSLLWLSHKLVGQSWKNITATLVVIGGILLIGHNALSADIYNYLFNAKMVFSYQADPHLRPALDFPVDPWLRFMHNVHTPAPYGYGWTTLSLIPGSSVLLGFLPSYLTMRLFMFLGWGIWLYLIWLLIKKKSNSLAKWLPLALSPLVLIETLGNGHNDVWMMIPALAGFLILINQKDKRIWQLTNLLALTLLGISISIKLATIVLLPIYLLYIVRQYIPQKWQHYLQYWPDASALLLLLPLLTSRSQWFHPWYLIWALSFLPLLHGKVLKSIFIALSYASLFRYVPWLFNNRDYSELILHRMRLVTWGGGTVLFLLLFFQSKEKRQIDAE